MLDTLIAIGISLAAFAVLLPLIVFVHEYGHFKVARLCGVKVDAFSIGFGPAMTSWVDKHGTVWKISAIPLGGYVKFFGDANAASAGTRADEDDEAKPVTTQFNSERDRLAAMLTEEEKRVCFHFKPVWQRAAVVAAGPIANFILALIIFAGIFMTIGHRIDEAVIGRVEAGSAAATAGFEPGDKIIAVNGSRIDDFDDLSMKVKLAANTERRFSVLRDGEEITLIATPVRENQTDALGNEVNQGRLGVELYISPVIDAFAEDSTAAAAGVERGDRVVAVNGAPIFTFSDIRRAVVDAPGTTATVVVERGGQERTFDVPVKTLTYTDPDTGEEQVWGSLGIAPERAPFERVGPITALALSADQVGGIIDGTLTFLGRLVTFQEDPSQLGGPIKIAKYAGQAATIGFDEGIEASLGQRILISLTTFVQLAALLSVSIGLLNLLPIPVLDGGHLVYYAYEAVAGQPLSDRVQGIGFRIGLAIVGSFMIFVIVNDVRQLF